MLYISETRLFVSRQSMQEISPFDHRSTKTDLIQNYLLNRQSMKAANKTANKRVYNQQQ